MKYCYLKKYIHQFLIEAPRRNRYNNVVSMGRKFAADLVSSFSGLTLMDFFKHPASLEIPESRNSPFEQDSKEFDGIPGLRAYRAKITSFGIDPENYNFGPNFLIIFAEGDDFTPTPRAQIIPPGKYPWAPDGYLSIFVNDALASYNMRDDKELNGKQKEVPNNRQYHLLNKIENEDGMNPNLGDFIQKRTSLIVHEYSHLQDVKNNPKKFEQGLRKELSRSERWENDPIGRILFDEDGDEDDVDADHRSYLTAKTEITAFSNDAFDLMLQFIKDDYTDPFLMSKNDLKNVIETDSELWDKFRDALSDNYIQNFDDTFLKKLFFNRVKKMWNELLKNAS